MFFINKYGYKPANKSAYDLAKKLIKFKIQLRRMLK